MTKYGYIRVSTREQNEDRQRLAMDQLDIPSAEHLRRQAVGEGL